MPDFLILSEYSPLGKENRPITFVGTDERKSGRAGVGHVGANVGKILKKPEHAKSKASGFALPEKPGGAKKGHNQLAERPSQNVNGLPEPAEEKMAALVNHQIDVIQKEKSGGIQEGVQEKQRVEDKPSDPRDAGHGLPFAELVFEEGHFGKRNNRAANAKGICGHVFR